MTVSAITFYVSATILAWLIIPLAYSFTNLPARSPPAPPAISLPIPLIIIIAIIVDPSLLISDLIISGPNEVVLNMPFYTIYGIFFPTYYIISLVILTIGHKRARTKLEKSKLKYLFIAYISMSFGAVFNLILPWVGNYQLIWVGPIGLIFLLFIIYLVITRYRLFNINLYASRFITWLLALSIFFGIGIALSSFVMRGRPIGEIITVTSLFLVAAVLFHLMINLIRGKLNEGISKTLLSNKLFDNVSRLAIDNSDAERMLGDIAHAIAGSSRSSFCMIQILVGDNIAKTCSPRRHNIPHADLVEIFAQLKKRKTGGIVTEEINGTSDFYKRLVANNISLTVALRDNNDSHIIGMIIIGQNRPTLYSDKEVLALAAIGDIIVIATKNSELSKLDKVKDEFMSLASHQLRTPLTSIHGYTAMLLDGDLGRITKDQSHALSEVLSSSERMSFLIGDLLNVSRLQAGKFVLQKTPTDLSEIARKEVEQLEFVAQSHDITLVYSAPKGKTPIIDLDGDKIGEVVANMIDNAIFYSKPGKEVNVEVYVNEETDRLELKVIDHGIGVPKKEQSSLFAKFFRGSNARSLRPNGTGIGLFLAKKIIAEHGGEVIFQSIESKGSTFGFSFPLATNKGIIK